MVDDCDYEEVVKFAWGISTSSGKTKYVKHSIKRDQITKKRSTVTLHHYIMHLHGLDTTNKQIDHIDRNTLNNCFSNLRISTQHENSMNRSKTENCSSQYKGVSWYIRSKKWMAYIKINNKKIHLGLFYSEIEAAKAYNEKAKELFGEFVSLNIIEEDLSNDNF